jgi:hypothetical protein
MSDAFEMDKKRQAEDMRLKSPLTMKTGLDITTGSIDRRAHAELDEIARMNQKNEYNPRNLQEFVESVRMNEKEIGQVSKKIEGMQSKYDSNHYVAYQLGEANTL